MFIILMIVAIVTANIAQAVHVSKKIVDQLLLQSKQFKLVDDLRKQKGGAS